MESKTIKLLSNFLSLISILSIAILLIFFIGYMLGYKSFSISLEAMGLPLFLIAILIFLPSIRFYRLIKMDKYDSHSISKSLIFCLVSLIIFLVPYAILANCIFKDTCGIGAIGILWPFWILSIIFYIISLIYLNKSKIK